VLDRRLLGADELGEEAALGEDLVGEYRPDGVRLLVGLVVEQGLGDRPPHADRLVGLAGIGLDHVLERRVGGRRHVLVQDGTDLVANRRWPFEDDRPGRRAWCRPPGSETSEARTIHCTVIIGLETAMRYLLGARVKPGRRAELLGALEDGTFSAGFP